MLVVGPDGAYLKNRLFPRSGRNFRPDARGWQHHVYFKSQSFAKACSLVSLSVACEGRAIFRQHLGLGFPWEHLRWLGLYVWTQFVRLTLLRRDIQAFVSKAEGSTFPS